MADVQFVDGMRVSRPAQAPEWVIAKLGLKREELIAWLEAQPGDWVNVELRLSKGGKYYAAVEAPRDGERRGRRDDDSESF